MARACEGFPTRARGMRSGWTSQWGAGQQQDNRQDKDNPPPPVLIDHVNEDKSVKVNEQKTKYRSKGQSKGASKRACERQGERAYVW